MPAKPFHVHAILYGGSTGPLLGCYATVAEAEAAHAEDTAGQALVIFGPEPQDETKTCVYSRRRAGKWVRAAILVCDSD